MYYNENIKKLNIALCVIMVVCALLSTVNVIDGTMLSKMILVGLSLQQLTIAYNDYKMNKKHRMIFSLVIGIAVIIVFIKFYM
ncbi:MAG: hypothetical protein ACRCXT_03420 [Paraclostridium sp.]